MKLIYEEWVVWTVGRGTATRGSRHSIIRRTVRSAAMSSETAEQLKTEANAFFAAADYLKAAATYTKARQRSC